MGGDIGTNRCLLPFVSVLFQPCGRLIPVCDADVSEPSQDFPGMAGVVCLLVLIQDDLAACVHLSRRYSPGRI